MRKLAALTAVVLVSAVAATAAMAHGTPGITLLSAKATGHTIVVTVRIHDWKMYPSQVGKKPNDSEGGHWHIFVDGKYNNFSANAHTGKALKVKAGWHTVMVELANNDHSELSPPRKSKTIRVHVA